MVSLLFISVCYANGLLVAISYIIFIANSKVQR